MSIDAIFWLMAFVIIFMAIAAGILSTESKDEASTFRTKNPDMRQYTPPWPGAEPTHYECVCGGSCNTPEGHDLCERHGRAWPCYCDLWKRKDRGEI